MAKPCNTLNTRQANLDIILRLIRSQCSDFSTVVICSNLRVPEIILAALLIRCWSLSISYLGRPDNKLLQYSILEATSERIAVIKASLVFLDVTDLVQLEIH